MKADSVRTILYALGANLAIAAAKTGGRDLHRLERHAGRGDPLLRRQRQPGPAALGHARRRSARRRPTTRWAGARRCSSGRSSSRWCCSRSAACSRSTKAGTSSPIPRRSDPPGSRSASWCSASPPNVVAPRMPARGQQGARRSNALAMVPRKPAKRAGGDSRRRPGSAARPCPCLARRLLTC